MGIFIVIYAFVILLINNLLHRNVIRPVYALKLGGFKTYGVNRIVLRPFPIVRIMNGEIEHLGWFDPVLP